jgi:hypothetical protein
VKTGGNQISGGFLFEPENGDDEGPKRRRLSPEIVLFITTGVRTSVLDEKRFRNITRDETYLVPETVSSHKRNRVPL